MSENADKEYAISISELTQETLEEGLIARLLAVPTDYFLYVLLNIDASCFVDFTARRVYQACLQGITASRTNPVSSPTEDLNLSESDCEGLGYIRKAIEGGYPCGPYVARCLLELHDRALLRKLAEQADLDEAWQEIGQECLDETDELEW
jgi:hypothetical protein